MMQELKINLLKRRRGITEAQYLLEKKIFVWSMVGFLVVVVVVVVLVGWQTILTMRFKRGEKELLGVKKQLTKTKVEEQKYVYVKRRLQLVRSFLQEREDVRNGLAAIVELLRNGFILQKVDLHSGGEISVRIEAESIERLRWAYRYLASNELFVKVTRKNINRNDKGKYEMGVVLVLPRKGGGR